MHSSQWSRRTALGLSLVLGTGIAMAQTGGGGSQTQQAPQQPGGGSPGGPGGTAPGANDGMNSMNTSASGGPSMQDKMFLRQAAEGGMFEIEAGKLALQKSSSDDVKQFAQHMIDDHSKLNEQMAPIAQKASVEPPKELKGKEKKELQKLQGLSGQAFDTEYIQAMLKAHKNDSDAFKMEASNGQFPDEKQAAAQGGAIVDQHLQMIKQIAQAHNVPEKS